MQPDSLPIKDLQPGIDKAFPGAPAGRKEAVEEWACGA
jgi:hypothetical protein